MNLSENDYHAYPAWSHSMLARYAREGFSSLEKLHDPIEPSDSMNFGSLFDSILTKGKKTLDDYVIDNTGVSCPPAEKEVFDKIIANGYGSNTFDEILSMHKDVLSSIINTCSTFCSKYKKEDTRISKLCENKSYYEMRRTGKKVITKEDWDDAIEMAKAFRESELLRNLFGTKNTEDIEYIYQLQLVHPVELYNGETVKFKIMLDLLKVDHKNKTLQPVDLKTSSVPGWNFKENFIKFRYDLQAHPYTDILEMVKNEIPEYADYTVLPFIFSDISRADKIPVSYVYDTKDRLQADGLSFGNYKYKHWKELLTEIVTYEKEHAKVPNYIKTEELNDLIAILNA